MRSSLAILALAATAFAAPQAVTAVIEAKGAAPTGCKASYDGHFEVSIFRMASKEKRETTTGQCNGEGTLVMTLEDGVLTDARNRTGYIASNYQWQFDDPPQAGAIYTAGFSACGNSSLALGSTTVFWQCKSGDFFNIYDRNWAEQCEPVEVVIMPCGDGSSTTKSSKRKVVGSKVVATTVVTVVSNGKSRLMTTEVAVPMCEIGDGQIQIRTTPCDGMTIGVITAEPVSQSSNGKLVVATAAQTITAAAETVAAVTTAAAATGAVTGAAAETEAAAVTSSDPADPVTETVIPAEVTSASANESVTRTVMQFDTSTPAVSVSTADPVTTAESEATQAAASASATSAPTASRGEKIMPASVVAMFVGVVSCFLLL